MTSDGRVIESPLEALIELGAESAWVVHGEDRLDEISTCASTRVVAWHEGRREQFILEPGDVVPGAKRADLLGGDAARNAVIAHEVLAGEGGPRRDVVVANAAGALVVAGRARSLSEGVAVAEESLDTGRARGVCERLSAFTRPELGA